MKVAVAGKGGAGKTTVAGTIARTLARSGRRVLALDADVNPMLGISLGLGPEETERLTGIRQALQDDEVEHQPTAEALVEAFGADAPDGVRLLVCSRLDRHDSGCACCGMTPDRLITALDAGDRILLCDLEAGVGTLSRLEQGQLDLVVVVANPTRKALEVARRAAETAAARGIRVIVAANRVRCEADLEQIRAGLPGYALVPVPEDPLVARAERDGLAPVDLDGSSPAVAAVAELSLSATNSE